MLKSFSNCFGDFKKLCDNGQLGKALEDLQNWETTGVHVSPSMYHCLLQKTSNISVGRHIISTLTRIGLFPNSIFGAVSICMFTACGTLQEAQWVFARLPQRDLLTWTAIMSAHTKHCQADEVIHLFARLQLSNLEVDQHIFVIILKACTSIVSLAHGMVVHGHIIEIGFETDTFVGNALVVMYTKCGNLKDGGKVFDALPSPSVVTWTMMIVGFTEQGHGTEALQLFWKMQSMSIIEPDKLFLIVEEGHDRVLTVSNTLVDVYAKCGSLEDARKVFQSNPERSLVTWNTTISALSQRQGQEQEAFHLLRLMKNDGLQPSHLTWNSMISRLVQQGQAQQGLEIFHKLLSEVYRMPEASSTGHLNKVS
ncbi:hypothetical protein L7F22_047601 [Adiantum nelumboides]|nr:hypothetical protein [Adiantum nelumboides]